MIYEKKNGKIVEYYTRRQAEEKGIQAIYWRDAKEAGQWILTDDGYVLLTTNVKPIIEYRNNGKSSRTRYRIVTGLGAKYPHGRAPFVLADHIRYRSVACHPRPWWESFRSIYPRMDDILLVAWMTGRITMSPSRRYTREEHREFNKLVKEIGFGRHHNSYNLKLYWGNEFVRELLRKKVSENAMRRNISVDKVFDLLEEVENLARKDGDGRILLALAKEYGGLIGLSTKGIPESQENERLMLDAGDASLDQVIQEHGK